MDLCNCTRIKVYALRHIYIIPIGDYLTFLLLDLLRIHIVIERYTQ